MRRSTPVTTITATTITVTTSHAVPHGKPLPFAPYDSPWKITAPIAILAVLAVGSGYLNAPAFGIHWFEHQTESSIGLPIDHGEEVSPRARPGRRGRSTPQ